MSHPALFPSSMKRVVAVELDPVLVKLMREEFSNFNRGFYNDPRVFPVTAEGRAFLSRSSERFDFIEYESLDTKMYTAAMNIVPIEFSLYTREGLQQAVQHLSDKGVLRTSLGTEDDERIVQPILSGLPSDIYYDVYRVFIDLTHLTGISGSGKNGGLAGWIDRMPQTAILASKDRKAIERVRTWYDSLDQAASDQILRIDVKPNPARALTDNHPFVGTGPASRKALVLIAMTACILLPALFFSRRSHLERMHYFFYLIGAGYVGLEILFLVHGTRSALNPSLAALVLVSMFVAGNAAACAVVSQKRPGRGTLCAVLALLICGVLFSHKWTFTPLIAMVFSLAIGFLGGLFWPTALAVLPRNARRDALSSNALGVLPGIICFHLALYFSGYFQAGILVSTLYAAATALFVTQAARPGKIS